ncbi:hypothetical protein A8C56_10205 [Niabella ginsenosidivorans]|uniref:Uncharacterized protein n=1 Tax=Niabella ginsenosidivorans TaxID=1176587 RepID=A0A1A9I1U7_9BACT|nr:hypothetical protein [Niabella ginsenosidivorans]ANH81305.1 hypothetical protein A8C56_10205 [Niabella ginsenosidivorans]
METDIYTSSKIYTPMMAGLFAGYIATLLNLFYDVLFRDYTQFPLHELVNVSTIIFATLFLLTIAGITYALFERLSSKGGILYTICSALFTALCVAGALHVHRTNNNILNNGFHHLLLGIVLITGIAATFAIPYLVKHKNLFI